MKSPTAAVVHFLGMWRKKDYEAMKESTQITWLKEQNNIDFPSFFGSMILKKWQIIKVARVGTACTDVKVAITYNFDGKNQKRRIKARVICEEAPYKPSLNGSWGLNPVSLLKGLI